MLYTCSKWSVVWDLGDRTCLFIVVFILYLFLYSTTIYLFYQVKGPDTLYKYGRKPYMPKVTHVLYERVGAKQRGWVILKLRNRFGAHNDATTKCTLSF